MPVGGRKPGAESPEPGYNRGMEPIRDPKVLARAQRAFDLCETAENMVRQKLRRKYPQASEAEIRARFDAWVLRYTYTGPGSS